jgi:hypothetical protein
MTDKIVHVTLTVDVEDLDDGTHDSYTTTRDHELRPHGLLMTLHQIDVIAERLADGYFTDESRVQ